MGIIKNIQIADLREIKMPIRVVVVEDHPLMLKAIVDVLSSHPGIQIVGKAEHGSELPRLVRDTTPDVVILDLGMSTGNFEPITAVRSLLLEYPNLHILVLTGYDDEIYIHQIIEAGAHGYVLKSDDLSLLLPEGVEKVYAGKRFYSDSVMEILFSKQMGEASILTQRELSAVRLASTGLANASIALALNISEKRVRNLMTSVYSKLGIHEGDVKNVRVAAINKARELGLLGSE
jgi:NarL family two-component system response regulator LiaR